MSEPAPLSRNSNFVRLGTAGVVSRFGSSLGYVALLWITYTETGSALAVAYVGIASFVPTVAVGIFSGALVDRFDRRRVVALSTLARGAAMGGLVIALELAGFHLVYVLAASLAFSFFATFYAPGSMALLPQIVGRASLADANGIFESTQSVAGIAGSAAGGVLILIVGAVPSLGVDAVSYGVGAVLVAMIVLAGTGAAPSSATPGSRMWTEVKEGLVYLVRSTGLFEMTLVALLLNFLFAFLLTFVVVYSTDLLHGSALVYGLLEGLLAAGWGAGGLLVGRLGLTRHTGLVWVGTSFVQGLLVVLLVLRPSVAVALPAFLGFGISQGIANVAWLSTVQATVPERLQGRYFATDTALSYAAIPLAQIVGGVLIALYGIGATFLVTGLGAVAVGVGALSLRELRRVGYAAGAPPLAPSG